VTLDRYPYFIMKSDAAFDPVDVSDRFFTVIKSLNEFDKAEIRGVVDTLISPTPREICFTGNYYRGVGNVDWSRVARISANFSRSASAFFPSERFFLSTSALNA
jgi:hypothetical protein